MATFEVDDDLAALVWQLAEPRPFENLTFSSALRRILQAKVTAHFKVESPDALQQLIEAAHARGAVKKAPTPSSVEWAANVPELKGKRGLHTWKAICDQLRIKTAGDSARRKLQNWVKQNRPNWPPVPDA